MVLKEKLEKKWLTVLNQWMMNQEESILKKLILTFNTKKNMDLWLDTKNAEKNAEPFLVIPQLMPWTVQVYVLLIGLVINLVCPNKTFALCELYPNAEIAIADYNDFKNQCEDLTGGGGTFYGKVLEVDSINSPVGYDCEGTLVNEGYILEYSCDNCLSANYQVSLYEDTLKCNKECKQSGRYCAFIFGEWGSSFN